MIQTHNVNDDLCVMYDHKHIPTSPPEVKYLQLHIPPDVESQNRALLTST